MPQRRLRRVARYRHRFHVDGGDDGRARVLHAEVHRGVGRSEHHDHGEHEDDGSGGHVRMHNIDDAVRGMMRQAPS